MAGLLGYLAALTDDISSLASHTLAGSTKAVASSLDNTSVMLDDIATYTKVALSLIHISEPTRPY